MGETEYKAYIYSFTVVIVFGILGNILVVISILRQKNIKNNYYFLVLQLAICDIGALIIFFLDIITWDYFNYSKKFYCLGFRASHIFELAGVGMMLVISVLRYRATVHPLKPGITRRKMKVVCGLVYVVCLIAGYGPIMPECLIQRNHVRIVYRKFHFGYIISCIIFFPTIFMTVVYFKIGRALIKQNKYIKSVCSNPARQGAPSSSFNIMKHIRNRKTFFVCLNTVLCYAVGNIPMTVYLIWEIIEEQVPFAKYIWIFFLANILTVAGSHSVNPLIYGILDKKLFNFWKLWRKMKKRGSQEN